MTRFGPQDFQPPSQSNDHNVGGTTCVDLACGDGIVELRDSKVEFGAPGDHRLRLTFAQFHAFQRGVRAGRTEGLPLMFTQRGDGRYELRGAEGEPPAAVLTFEQAEVDAFLHDVHTGRYDTRLLASA